jgi:hypothetical protein
MFCQCYFKTAAHGIRTNMPARPSGSRSRSRRRREHFCKFNNAYKINKGSYSGTKLDGAKFWIYGDLGGDFSKGQLDWAVVTFDKATTPEQRKAIGEICGALFPVKWNSMTTSEGAMEWTHKGDIAYATLEAARPPRSGSTRRIWCATTRPPRWCSRISSTGVPRATTVS